MTVFDEDATTAATELIGRTGARDLEVGYLHDDVPVEKAGWYASAQYRGTRITVEDQAGPDVALEALARRLLAGGTCRRCGNPIALEDGHQGACRWTRMGQHWESGCGLPIDTSIPAMPR